MRRLEDLLDADPRTCTHADLRSCREAAGSALAGIRHDTEKIGRAMLRVARQGYPKRVLESADINVAAA